MPCQINNKSNFDISEIEGLIQDLFSFSQQRHNFQEPVVLNLKSDENNTSPLGKTAHYDPSSMEIVIYVDGRHPKDIMRSFSHELVHHKQNEAGMFEESYGETGDGYAQSNPHLRKMEKEAYLEGSICFRDWEDGYKSSNPNILNERRIYKMSTKDWKNKELNGLLNERWGFTMDLNKLNEACEASEEEALEETEETAEVVEEEVIVTENEEADADEESEEEKSDEAEEEEQEIEQILDDSDATEDVDESTMEQIVAAIESLTLGELQDLVKAKESEETEETE